MGPESAPGVRAPPLSPLLAIRWGNFPHHPASIRFNRLDLVERRTSNIWDDRWLQVRHRLCLEQFPALARYKSGRRLCFFPSRTICRNPRSGIHLSIQLREEDEPQPRAQGWRATRSSPDGTQCVKAVPYFLRAIAYLARTHQRMWREHLGSDTRGYQPETRDWRTVHKRWVFRLFLLPIIEVHCTGKRCHHHKLCKCDSRPQRQIRRCFERFGFVRRQSENE